MKEILLTTNMMILNTKDHTHIGFGDQKDQVNYCLCSPELHPKMDLI